MSLITTRFGANAPGLPAPAPIPPIRDALQRRAAIFGPFDADPAPVASRGPLARLSGVVDLLLPRGTR